MTCPWPLSAKCADPCSFFCPPRLFTWASTPKGFALYSHTWGSASSAVIQREDDDGVLGVKIGKELMKVAGQALEMNIRSLGPKVLPLSEKLLFAANLVARKVIPSHCCFKILPLYCRATMTGWG